MRGMWSVGILLLDYGQRPDSVSKIPNRKGKFHGRLDIAAMSQSATKGGNGSVLRISKAFAGGGLDP